eukprot:Awhi_evm1s321
MEERISADCVDILTDYYNLLFAMKILALCTSCFLKRNFVHFAHVKGMEEKTKARKVPDLQSIEPPIDTDNDNGDSIRNDEDTIILDDGYND